MQQQFQSQPPGGFRPFNPAAPSSGGPRSNGAAPFNPAAQPRSFGPPSQNAPLSGGPPQAAFGRQASGPLSQGQLSGPPQPFGRPAPPAFAQGPPQAFAAQGPPAMQAPPQQPPHGQFATPQGASGPPQELHQAFGRMAVQPAGPPRAPPMGHAPPMNQPPPMNQAPGSYPPMGQGPPTMMHQMQPQHQPTSHGPSPLQPLRSYPPAMQAPGSYPQATRGTALPSGDFNQGNYAAQQPMMAQTHAPVLAAPCDPRYLRMTVNAVAHSQEHATKSALPYGLVLQPLAEPEDGKELPVVNFGASGVVRCKSCRAYINPYIQWMDNGRRWRCNLCGIANDVPSSYFCHLNANGVRHDIDERPELRGSVEIIAPSEYTVRPPIPPAFVFVVDVSAQAVASGMVQVAAETILAQLDNLPGEGRTRFGLITYDSHVHFYNLKAGLKAPQMMVVPDINELFIPIPDELLVNLSDSRDVIESLLEMLPRMHQGTRNPDTCLGPAIRAAFRLMTALGGKMLVFQSSLPTTGQGALKHRDDPRLLGSEKEQSLLNPVDTFYRKNAIEFCRQQVSVDTFLFAPQYTDVASLAPLSKYSGGQLFYYLNFSAPVDGHKFATELGRCLTRETGWEAILRLRCTKGMRFSNYYGNSFLRGPDLLAVPSVHADAAFGVELEHSDTLLTSNTISIQAAVLYTTSSGERRIRVHTTAIPVVKAYADLFHAVDMDAMCNLVAKSALEVALKTGLPNARNKLQAVASDVARAYRTYGGSVAGGYQLQLPTSLQLLPLYMMSLMKNPAFRGGNDIGSDERSATQYTLNNLSVTLSRTFIYPRLFSLLEMPQEAGLPIAEGELPPGVTTAGAQQIQLPPVVNLSVDRLNTEGAFLLDDTVSLHLWLGRNVSPRFLQSLFGTDTIDGVDPRQLQLVEPTDDLGTRLHNIFSAIREDRPAFLKLHVLHEGAQGEGRFFWKLVEDRASFNGGTYSYAEFLGQVNRGSQGGK
ncbi:hypothetical protein SDRG_06627 [Saprolegnia diclina VS20]|uniref:Protein transporter SEC24 n=1 Tax=Saprolegnia diclina (strain VS20) TaxID=1156394 RepID=T0RZM3_SAPDV|nr:hypothetical protein SDRG_06627 [Saprolegnia diclina VS20]EQC35877.1 hypothetical protein SDRG_06627 [Saprolegnia diclina VS20]|eukprot:XP_008610639.1 hypothetical protein SDRG_06627 [Saprolegnia diclina VS20]